MEERQWMGKEALWKNEVIAALLLISFAFFINRGIKINGLYMDDLYLWSCYGEQTFRQFVIPLGSTRFRFVYYLAAWLEMMALGSHTEWFVPFNILLNSCIAYTIYRFGKRLSHRWFVGLGCGIYIFFPECLTIRSARYTVLWKYGSMDWRSESSTLCTVLSGGKQNDRIYLDSGWAVF